MRNEDGSGDFADNAQRNHRMQHRAGRAQRTLLPGEQAYEERSRKPAHQHDLAHVHGLRRELW